MKKNLLTLIAILSFSAPAMANNHCFLATENGKIIKQEGSDEACNSRHTTCSTFKLAISVMGYDSGILLDETHPKFPFEKGYYDSREIWRQAHDPKMWIQNSCIWFSQVVTQKLGMKKFAAYAKSFNYGNQDVSGTKEKSGLMWSWISNSLQISPKEQTEFLEKLTTNKLPVSKKAHEMTRNIAFVEELPNGWKFYGKTGACDLFNEDGSVKENKVGWFVGWAQKDNRTIVFANYTDNAKDYTGAKAAQAAARQKILELSSK